MPSDPSRSEQVIENYKKRKLASAALHRIHQIIEGFEQDRLTDRRLAWIGIGLLLALIAGWAIFLFSGERVNL